MLQRDQCANCGHVHAPVNIEHQSLEIPIEIRHDDGHDALLLHDVQTALTTTFLATALRDTTLAKDAGGPTKSTRDRWSPSSHQKCCSFL